MRTALLTALVLAAAAPTALAQGSLERVHGRLIVEVNGDAEGVSITVDGLLLPRDRWGVPTRVELGTHLVEARRSGEVVSSSETVVVRGGDAHVHLSVAPPRAVTEGPLRIEPASRPSTMTVSEDEPEEASPTERYEPTRDEAVLADDDLESADVDEAEGMEDDDSEGIPSWVYWGAGGVALAVLLIIVISVAAADSGGRPIEGDLMPGVLRF